MLGFEPTFQLLLLGALWEFLLNPLNEVSEDPCGLGEMLLAVPGSHSAVSASMRVDINL